ncbi:MAG: sugar ABC transporter permease, partial [Conexivisphaerales archaeon]
MKKTRLKENLAAYIFLGPSLVFFAIFFIFSVGFSIWVSFKRWDMLTPVLSAKWVGISNYISVLSDSLFRSSLLNTLIYTGITLIITLFISLLVAVALNNVKGAAVWRFIYFAPTVTPAVAIGMIWSYLYRPSQGIINEVLGYFGVPPINWLTDPRYVLVAIMIAAIWENIGLFVIIYTAGLKSIPQSYYDAATIDGASQIRTFFSITIPLLQPTTLFLSVTGAISALQVFDLVYILGANAPQNSCIVMSIYVYQQAFQNFSMGVAAAASMI